MKKTLSESSIIPSNIKLTIHKSSKRTKLIRWLFEVTLDFCYSPFTYIRTVVLLDKFPHASMDTQLVGIAALLLCAKVEER
ncbi:hypothetical protein COBT_001581, partial [Conglomerata obtusa]